MSDPTVTAFLTKLLCSHGGRLPRERLTQLLELPPEQIELILQDEAQRFPQVGELVLAQSPIRICPRYLKNEGEEEEEECGRLHLCRRYLRGNCRQSKRYQCMLSHDILSDHNQMVLKSNEISGLNDQELKVLLLQNDNQMLPEVCWKYLNDTCDQGNACTRMHVCGYFTRGECNRHVCRRSHHLLEVIPDLLQNIPIEAVQNFQMLCVLKHGQRHQEAGTDTRREATRGPRGRGRGRAKSRGRNRSRGVSQDKSRERETEGPGSQVRGRSSSRPASESHRCGSEDDDDDGEDNGGHQKTELDKLMEDWFLPDTSGSGNTQVGSDRRPKLSAASSNPPKARPVQSDTTIPNAAQTRVEQISSVRSNKAMIAPIAPLIGSSQPIRTSHVPPTSSGGLNSNYSSAGESGLKTVTSIRDGIYTPHPTALAGSTKLVITPISATSSASPIAQPLTQYRLNRPTSSPVTPTFATTLLGELYKSDAQSKLTAASYYTPTARPFQPNTTLPNAAQTRAEHISPVASNKVISAPTDPLQRSSQPLGPSSVPPTSSVGLTSNQPTPLTGANSIYSKVSSDLSARPTGPPPVPARSLSTITAPAEAAIYPIGGISSIHVSSVYINHLSRLSGGADQHPRNALASVKPVSRLDLNQSSSTRSADEVPKPQPVDKTSPDRPTSSSKSTPGKAPDICLSNIWMYCKLGGNCPDMHFYLPYRWQVFNGGDWEDVSNMENVEKAYCDPKVTRIPLVDFETMKSGTSPVRRLSTPSSVTKPSEYVMTTEWMWYWKDEYGTWTQYGQSNIKNVSSTILCADLESIYLSDPTARIPFTAGQQHYEINFREMKQRNIVYRTEKEVCRRPKFLSFEDVKMLKGRSRSHYLVHQSRQVNEYV